VARPKKLHIDLAELCIAREVETGDLDWFLDTENGAVLLLNSEYEPAKHHGVQPIEIESNPLRFIPIEAQTQVECDEDLRSFCETLADRKLKESISLALSASRPEKRIRALLQWVPEQLAAWYQFRKESHERRARQWLTSLGIELAQKAA
jgi:hypothetical protein